MVECVFSPVDKERKERENRRMGGDGEVLIYGSRKRKKRHFSRTDHKQNGIKDGDLLRRRTGKSVVHLSGCRWGDGGCGDLPSRRRGRFG